MARRRNTISDFFDRLYPEPNTGCILFAGSEHVAGYGMMSIKGFHTLAHRIAWELEHGPIPSGMTIDHLCRVPACCNTSHLEVVTMKVNLSRCNAASSINRQKTHCPKGHPYSSDNLCYKKSKYGLERRCLICKRSINRAGYHRNKKLKRGLKGC